MSLLTGPGDDKSGTTATLCVRRAQFWDAEAHAFDPAKAGVCSNYLCDAMPGDEVRPRTVFAAALQMQVDKVERVAADAFAGVALCVCGAEPGGAVQRPLQWREQERED